MMKKCPKCNSDYFDNMLDFCLEDGTRLVAQPARGSHAGSALSAEQRKSEDQTIAFAAAESQPRPNIEQKNHSVIPEKQTNLLPDTKKLKTSLTEKWNQFLEITPLILALAHNFWQWLYLAKQNFYQLTDFLLSANFLIWLLLLISGIAFGIVSVKYSRNRRFAITALVVLAINFLLFLVPK